MSLELMEEEEYLENFYLKFSFILSISNVAREYLSVVFPMILLGIPKSDLALFSPVLLVLPGRGMTIPTNKYFLPSSNISDPPQPNCVIQTSPWRRN